MAELQTDKNITITFNWIQITYDVILIKLFHYSNFIVGILVGSNFFHRNVSILVSALKYNKQKIFKAKCIFICFSVNTWIKFWLAIVLLKFYELTFNFYQYNNFKVVFLEKIIFWLGFRKNSLYTHHRNGLYQGMNFYQFGIPFV